jgi:hypothetical protein
MFRVVKNMRNQQMAGAMKRFSTKEAPKNPAPSQSGNRDNMLLLGGAAVAGILFTSYKLETDAEFAKSAAEFPGIGLLDPVREGLVSSGLITKAK